MKVQPPPKDTSHPSPFPGFDIPRSNWFKMPMEWTNITAGMRSLAVIKVVEYVLKHTWGYSEFTQPKKITLDEFEHGRKRNDNTRLDKGCGLSRRHIIRGLKEAEAQGYIQISEDGRDKARRKKYYQIRLSPQAQNQGFPMGTSDVPMGNPWGHQRESRTEIDTVDRNFSKRPLTVFKKLATLPHPIEKRAHIAQDILDRLGDEHSQRFYALVAAKVPETVIRQALAEIKVDGAREPARLFTYKMKLYALKQGKAGSGRLV